MVTRSRHARVCRSFSFCRPARLARSKAVQAQQVQFFLRLPPFEQQRVRLRAGGAGDGVGNAVAAEMAEVPAQCAPGGEQARVFKVAEGDGPHRARARLPGGVGVVEVEGAMLAQRAADVCQRLLLCRAAGRRLFAAERIEGLCGEARRPFFRQHVVDFAEQAARGSGHVIIALDDGGADAEDQRLDFVFVEHQRRQEEVRLVQHETGSRRATDVRALLAQRVDVAVDGAQADAEAGGERGRADGTAAVAQVLQQGEQALATGHAGQVLYIQVSGKGVCKRIFGLLNGLHGSLVNATPPVLCHLRL